MRKMSVRTTLALLLFLVLGSTVAYASFNWCPDDPVLDIGGTKVKVIINLGLEPGEKPEDFVNGPVRVTVYVPKGVDASVISTGDGFGQGEEVTIKRKGKAKAGKPVKVEAKVKVPATEELPVIVEIKAPGVHESTEGWTNEWVKCKVELEVEDGDGHHGDHDDRDDDH